MFVLIICENVEKICMFLPTFKQEYAIEYETIEDCSVTTM